MNRSAEHYGGGQTHLGGALYARRDLAPWITGEAFAYTHWGGSEPNVQGSFCGLGDTCYEHCLMSKGNGDWNDRRCDDKIEYVCEWDPPGG